MLVLGYSLWWGSRVAETSTQLIDSQFTIERIDRLIGGSWIGPVHYAGKVLVLKIVRAEFVGQSQSIQGFCGSIFHEQVVGGSTFEEPAESRSANRTRHT